MAGALRAVFGVCANEWSPSDGQVVSLDLGGGAHSETEVEVRAEHVDAPVLDELGYVEVEIDRTPAVAEPVADETVVEQVAVLDEPVVDEPVAVEQPGDEPVAEDPPQA